VLAVRILSALPFLVLVAIIDGSIFFDTVKGKQVSTDELRLKMDGAYSGFTARQPILRVSVAMLKSVPEDEKLREEIFGDRQSMDRQSETIRYSHSKPLR